MILYHTSYTEIPHPDLLHSRPRLDFGVGFYLTPLRAQAIVNKLVEMGIAANRLFAKGMGQNAPLADNSTEEGRAKNRRVEFIKK